MYNKNENKLVMCSPCCSNCPEAFTEENMVVLTDDNDLATSGIRKIKLTKDQFKDLLNEGKNLIK